jgi:GntR family transcriptional regulator
MKTEINKPIPYYFQIYELLKESIDSKEWKPGDFIPSERILSENFSVSRITIRKALDTLILEGYIKKIQGKGVIICEPKIEERILDRLVGTFQDLQEKGFKIKTKLLSFSIVNPNEIVKNKLNLNNNDDILRIERLRFVDKESFHYSKVYLPEKIFKDFDKNLLITKSLYSIISENYNYKISKINRRIEASVASEDDSKLLKVKIGTPVLYFENLTFLENDTPIEYSVNKIRGDMAKFDIEVKRINGSTIVL